MTKLIFFEESKGSRKISHLKFRYTSFLGMPSQNKKNKSKLFSKIKEHVWKALQSWKGPLFSAGGKKILIKAIIQAIPTYTMSCFKLPISLCEDIINKMSVDFWWGQGKSRKRVHWLSWKRLCVSKDSGGMRSRDIQLFNQAMLAKIGWRRVKNPTSLLA